MTIPTQDVSPSADLNTAIVPCASLLPAPYNPRMIEDANFERLKDSVRRFGLVDPILVNRRSGLVVSGHQRLKAAIDIGIVDAPVRYLDLSDDEERAVNIALNQPNLMGEYDDTKLAEILAALPDDLRGLTGFDDTDLSRLMDEAQLGDDGLGGDPDELPDEVEAISKVGEVYELGPHRLACGDSRDGVLVGRLFGDERASLVWTDPPYGVSIAEKAEDILSINGCGQRRDRKVIQNDSLPPEECESVMREALALACKFSLPGGALYAAAAAGDMLIATSRAMTDAGFRFRWQLIWVKHRIGFCRSDYQFQHENICYGWKEDAAHYFTDDRTQSSVFNFDRPTASPEHPTMKPVELVEAMVRNSSRRGEIVYDCFGGSGSTLIACERLDRRAFLTELSPHYCDVIRARYAKYVGTAAMVKDDAPVETA